MIYYIKSSVKTCVYVCQRERYTQKMSFTEIVRMYLKIK